jgi:hypothetical protein
MKKIFLVSAIILSAACYNANAQVSVHINIGRQPVWGPPGYDYVNYYYLPDYDVYYDVPRGLFVYFDLGRWNFGPSLPARYGHYDLYHSYKVVINDRDPWLRHDYYRSHYEGYRGRRQPVIKDSHDKRYFAGREGHWDNGRGNGGRNNGRGNGRGHDKDHGNHGHGDHDRGRGHDDHDHGKGDDHGRHQ